MPLLGLLAACGGDSGGGATAPVDPPATVLASAVSLAQQWVAPRAGSSDRQGSIDTEKSWVRSFMDETYLWYKDVSVVNAANFTLASNGNCVIHQ